MDENPHIRHIALCMDGNLRGGKAAERLGVKYMALSYETEICFPPSVKDWNEQQQMKGEKSL